MTTTPSQTVGPYFGYALPWEDGPWAVPADTPGLVTIGGQITDGAGEAVPDALVETWQADDTGRFDHPDDPRGTVSRAGYRWLARCPTDSDGQYAIHTLKPGALPGPHGREAPHINVTILARGLLRQLVTRIYFPDESAANAADPVLREIPPDRSSTLVARTDEDGFRFDIRLRGDHETVFFAV